MNAKLLILAAAAAGLLLMAGVYRFTRPVSALMGPEEAQARLEDAAARFNAAIDNKRDVGPLLADIKPIVEQHPRLRDARVLLGQWYTHTGDHPRAYEQFARALELDPADAPLHNLAGATAVQMDQLNLAQTHHRAAVENEPDNPRWLLSLGDALLKLDRLDEAKLAFLEVLRQNLTLHEAHAGLADVFALRGGEGDLQRAIEQMEKARAGVYGEPDRLEAHVAYVRKLARLYDQNGEAMEAARVVDTLTPAPARRRPEVLEELAGYLARNGQPVAAALEYQFALEAQPDYPAYAAGAARWLIEAGRRDAARGAVERLGLLDPDHPELQTLREALAEAP